jgi:hypothetical protein
MLTSLPVAEHSPCLLASCRSLLLRWQGVAWVRSLPQTAPLLCHSPSCQTHSPAHQQQTTVAAGQQTHAAGTRAGRQGAGGPWSCIVVTNSCHIQGHQPGLHEYQGLDNELLVGRGACARMFLSALPFSPVNCSSKHIAGFKHQLQLVAVDLRAWQCRGHFYSCQACCRCAAALALSTATAAFCAAVTGRTSAMVRFPPSVRAYLLDTASMPLNRQSKCTCTDTQQSSGEQAPTHVNTQDGANETAYLCLNRNWHACLHQ